MNSRKSALSAQFLAALPQGVCDTSTGTRARYSTDAGNYRVVPEAVCFPTSTEDVLTILEACRTHKVPITSRGGGTSCAGNAIGPGIIIDFTRHLNKVISIDPEARTATVEPGCVQSDLQKAAAVHGLRFGPDPSSMNRCSIGGMVGNNACGPHATAWGRTSDNVISLDCIDGTGRRFTATLNHAGEIAIPEIPELAPLIDANLALIRTELGRFGRQVSGYSLEHLTPESGRNLAAMLVGTEGTLVTVLSITVRLVPLPTAPVLVTLGYPTMVEAADDVPTLLAHHPLAVEGLDARLVDVVRRHKGPGAVPELPEGQGWLMVEMGGDNAEDSLARAHALAEAAHTDAVLVYPPGEQASALWRIRADGAGLGGRTPVDPDTGEGNEQAWPGLEDAAVPPEKLGAYLRDFDALCAQYEVDGLLFGHFGDGCVHVRLNLPLETEEGVAHSRRFLEDSARLIARHGGSVSGEHGDGRARSELLGFMYSSDMLDLFGKVKHIFDPECLLNPGVLISPLSPTEEERRARVGEDDPQVGVDRLDHFLRRPDAQPIPAGRGFAFVEDGGDFTTAVHRCTGVGKCRASVPDAFMCPSYAVTGEEKDVTRGRARILQEAANGRLVASLASREVAEALDLCLACKACSSDCPAGVDMAKFRSEVFSRRFRGKLRPLSHYSLGWLPRWTRLVTRVPGAAFAGNAVLSVGFVRRLVFWMMGLDPRRKMARLQARSFRSQAGLPQASADLAGELGDLPTLPYPEATPVSDMSPANMSADAVLNTVTQEVFAGTFTTSGTMRHSCADDSWQSDGASDGRPRYVVLWVDSFSDTLETRGAVDIVRVLEAQGFTVLLAPDVCCGLTWITTGQLESARSRLRDLVEALAPFAVNGIPIVGIEPSCTAVLRDDLVELLPDDPRAKAVKAAAVTLAELVMSLPEAERVLPDLSGVELIAQPHCHHYSVMGWSADRALLSSLGARVTELSGCCGLAGNFGMERGHYEVSVAIAERSLLPSLRANPGALYLADGFSCRTQARQLIGREGVHLATLLRMRENE